MRLGDKPGALFDARGGRGKEGIDAPKAQRRLFGFFGAKSQAIDSLTRVEGLLEMMKLSRADFSTPQRLLEEARTSLAMKDYRKSLRSAEQAERLAEVIEERYRSARKAMGILRSEIKDLEDLGLDSTEAKSALETARQRIKQGTMEDGCLIPNYLEARISAEAAAKDARAQIIKAREASDQIFTAQLALDALREMQGPIEPQTLESAVVAPLDEILQKSTETLAQGSLEDALALAKDAEEKANAVRADYMECMVSLESCENVLRGLSSEGVPVERASQLLTGGKSLLALGRVTDAKDAIVKAEKEALMVSNQYRKAVATIEAAEAGLRELSKTGLTDAEAEKRLRDARKALSGGKYLRALDLAEDCKRSVSKRIEVHNELGRSLRELRETVDGLHKSGVTFAGDVDEILGKAEREYEEGDYANCGKDMKIASVMIGSSGYSGKNPLYLLKETAE